MDQWENFYESSKFSSSQLIEHQWHATLTQGFFIFIILSTLNIIKKKKKKKEKGGLRTL